LVVVFMPKLLDNSLVTPMDSTADEENWSSSGNMIELFRSQGGLGGYIWESSSSNKPSSSPRSAILYFMRRVRDMQVLGFHGVRMVVKSNMYREVSELDHGGIHVVEIVVMFWVK
jgi:hypothetical protein